MTFHHPIIPEVSQSPAEEGPLFSVRLIDRRTGSVPRRNGIPLSVLTRTPRQAVSDLMRGRNRAIWSAEVEAMEPHKSS